MGRLRPGDPRLLLPDPRGRAAAQRGQADPARLGRRRQDVAGEPACAPAVRSGRGADRGDRGDLLAGHAARRRAGPAERVGLRRTGDHARHPPVLPHHPQPVPGRAERACGQRRRRRRLLAAGRRQFRPGLAGHRGAQPGRQGPVRPGPGRAEAEVPEHLRLRPHRLRRRPRTRRPAHGDPRRHREPRRPAGELPGRLVRHQGPPGRDERELPATRPSGTPSCST